jgi:molybdopterin-guanine dinucleotide biosynthesis protein A
MFSVSLRGRVENSEVSGVNFSAVLLAGGLSKRMGRDKALLPWGGGLLWEHQLATLRALEPAELLFSTRRGQLYAAPDARLLPDERGGFGPLEGLALALSRMDAPWLVVLAVDLPRMTADYLAQMLERAGATGKGVVPELAGWFEPLAAVYPKSAAALASELLAGPDLSLQTFVRRCREAGLVEMVSVSPGEAGKFRNLNTPEDL